MQIFNRMLIFLSFSFLFACSLFNYELFLHDSYNQIHYDDFNDNHTTKQNLFIASCLPNIENFFSSTE